jgi:hypothetical protein
MKWSGVMRKSVRKNPHAVALGRLGGAVGSEAKQLANQENGRKGGLAKSRQRAAERRSPVGNARVFLVVVGPSSNGRNGPDP